jgi:hypothetical protein
MAKRKHFIYFVFNWAIEFVSGSNLYNTEIRIPLRFLCLFHPNYVVTDWKLIVKKEKGRNKVLVPLIGFPPGKS